MLTAPVSETLNPLLWAKPIYETSSRCAVETTWDRVSRAVAAPRCRMLIAVYSEAALTRASFASAPR
jgi:hypothetical protein